MSNPCTAVKFLDDSVVDLRSLGVDALVGDQGWVTLETVLIQVRTKFTPSGRFPVYFNRVSPFSPSDQVGYDAAVCVQKYESWIIETWKTSVTSPSVLRIVGKGDGNPPLSPRGNIRGTPIANTRYLNTTGSDVPFTMAHQGATNQTMKDIYYPTWTSPGILTGTVCPPMPPCTTFLLTSTHSTGYFSHWRRAIHRTISSQVRQYPRTVWCGSCSAIPGGVRTRRRTSVRGRDASIRHIQTVATDRPTDTYLDPWNRRRTVRADITAGCPKEGIWGLQLAGAVSISGMWTQSYSVHKG